MRPNMVRRGSFFKPSTVAQCLRSKTSVWIALDSKTDEKS